MKRLVSVAILVAVAGWVDGARAQDVDTSTVAASESEGEEVETLMVTATRRTTRLFETPVAVTSVSQNALIERNVVNVLGIEKLVPSLKVQDQRTLGMGAIQLSLRGVGNTNFHGAGGSERWFSRRWHLSVSPSGGDRVSV